MVDPWLIARPIAHRGLHDRLQGRVENSASAALAAVAQNFAIECDVQLSADGEAMTFHDFDLERLTGEKGRIIEHTARKLSTMRLLGGPDVILPLADFLGRIGGRVPVIVEIKSLFDGDMRLSARVIEILRPRAAPIALKSFDPQIVAFLRARESAPGLRGRPIGQVAQAVYSDEEWSPMPIEMGQRLAALYDYSLTRPDFLSYRVADLPHAAPHLFRAALKKPVMTWTVRSPEQRALADEWADQMIFEGFVP